MEIWFVIGVVCSIGYVGVWIADLYQNIQFNKQMRKRYMNKMRRNCKVEEEKIMVETV